MVMKMIEELYEQHIKSLSLAERLELVELIVRGLANSMKESDPRSRSLMELEGLGAEIWQGIEPQAYVDELRKEWNKVVQSSQYDVYSF